MFIANTNITRAAPKYWKSKQIDRVCHSLKDAESLNLLRLVVDSVFAAHQLEFNKEMYLDSSFNITIGKEFIDSKLSLETITSSKQVDKKTLRMTVIDLRNENTECHLQLVSPFFPAERIWAGLLMKEKCLPKDLEDVLIRNEMNLLETHINDVRYFG